MKRSEKDQIVAEVKEKAGKASGMYLADFTGITVEEVSELRREFRKSSVDYQVVKNTLAKKALAELEGFEKVVEHLQQPTAIAFGYDDPVAPARIIKKFRDKSKKLNVKVCVVEKRVYEGAEIDMIAKLPTRKEVMAGIVGAVAFPATGIAGAVNAVLRDLVGIIDAIEKKKAA